MSTHHFRVAIAEQISVVNRMSASAKWDDDSSYGPSLSETKGDR